MGADGRDIVLTFRIQGENFQVFDTAGNKLGEVAQQAKRVSTEVAAIERATTAAIGPTTQLGTSFLAGIAGGAAIEGARLIGVGIQDITRFLQDSVSAYAQSERGARGLGVALDESNRQWSEFKTNLGGVIDNTFHLTGLLETLGSTLKTVNGYLSEEQVLSLRGVDAIQAEIDKRINRAAAQARAASGGRFAGDFYSPEERAAVGQPDFIGPVEDPNSQNRRITRNQEEAIRNAKRQTDEEARRQFTIAAEARAQERAASSEAHAAESKARQEERQATREREQAQRAEAERMQALAQSVEARARQERELAEDQVAAARDLGASQQEINQLARLAAQARQQELGAQIESLNVTIQYGTEQQKITAEAERQLLVEKEKATQQREAVRQQIDAQRQQAEALRQQQDQARQAANFIQGLGSVKSADDLQRFVGGYGAEAANQLIGRLYTKTATSLAGSTGTDASSTITGAGAAGGVGAAGYAAIAAAVIGGTIEALQRSSDEKKRFGATDASVLSEAQYGAISGAFEAVGFGGIGKGLGKLGKTSPAAGAAIDFIFTGGLSTILGAAGAFQAPTRGTQIKDYLEESIRKNSQFFPLEQDIKRGGHTGIDTKFFELPLTQAERERYDALGFDRVHSLGSLEESNLLTDAARERQTGSPYVKGAAKQALGADIAAGILGLPTGGGGLFFGLFGKHKPQPDTPDSRAAEEVYEGLAAQQYQQVSNLRFGSSLGFSQVILGNTGRPGDVQSGSNAITNNLLGLGINAKEARQEVRALADDFGVTLPNAFLELRKQGLEGNIKSVEQFTAGLRGVADLFRDDLPRGVDIAGIAIKNMFEGENGNVIFNARQALLDIQKRVGEIATQEQQIASGQQFASQLTGPGGVSDALRTEIFNVRSSTLTGSRQRNFLQSAYDTRTQAGLNALGQLDRLGDASLLSPEQQQLAGQAFDSTRAAIFGNIDLAAQRYGVGTSRYKQAVEPYLAQLAQLDQFTSLLADDTQRQIDALNAGFAKVVAAIEAQNQGTTGDGDGTGSKTIELKIDVNGQMQTWALSPQGVATIQKANAQ